MRCIGERSKSIVSQLKTFLRLTPVLCAVLLLMPSVVFAAETENTATEWHLPDGEAFLIDPVSDETPVNGMGTEPAAGWNLKVIGLGSAIRDEYNGQSVRIGVVDSGINALSVFEDRLLPGYNYTPDAGDVNDTSDSLGHGTGVAAIISASANSVCPGVAPGAQIVPLKVTDEKSVKISAICNAIYGGVDDFECDVLNLSLASPKEYPELKEAVEYAESKGVLVVSSVGNRGNSMLYYPAAHDTVIGVGSVDMDGVVSPNSNHNESVFLTAPGVDVCTVDPGGACTVVSGTSFSTPHAAGAAAILLGISPQSDPDEIRQIMAQTAFDRGEDGYDEYYGYGILDVGSAIKALKEQSLDQDDEEPVQIKDKTDGPADISDKGAGDETDKQRKCVYQTPYDDIGTDYHAENGIISNVVPDLSAMKEGVNRLTMNTGSRLILSEGFTVSDNFADPRDYKKVSRSLKYSEKSGWSIDLKKLGGKSSYELVLVCNSNRKKLLVIDVIDLSLNRKSLNTVTLSETVEKDTVSRNAVSENKITEDGFAENGGVVTISTSPVLRTGITGQESRSARFISGIWMVGNTVISGGSTQTVTKNKVMVHAKVNSDGTLSMGKAEGSGKGNISITYILNGRAKISHGKVKFRSKAYKARMKVQ